MNDPVRRFVFLQSKMLTQSWRRAGAEPSTQSGIAPRRLFRWRSVMANTEEGGSAQAACGEVVQENLTTGAGYVRHVKVHGKLIAKSAVRDATNTSHGLTFSQWRSTWQRLNRRITQRRSAVLKQSL